MSTLQTHKNSYDDVLILFLKNYLSGKITGLSKEGLEDLSGLLNELKSCEKEEERKEIEEAVREIIFPELIGQLNYGEAGSIHQADKLEARKARISRKVKELRRQSGMTQQELAEKSGLPQSHISRLEKGVHSPSYKTMERIANVFGVKHDELEGE
jgi:DNA-binding XRE family transcriptional regulator